MRRHTQVPIDTYLPSLARAVRRPRYEPSTSPSRLLNAARGFFNQLRLFRQERSPPIRIQDRRALRAAPSWGSARLVARSGSTTGLAREEVRSLPEPL